MNPMEVFHKYAAVFEVAYANDHWEMVEDYFTDDISYEVFKGPPLGGLHEGREAVMKFLKGSVNDFDRRFAERIPRMVEGPIEKDGGIWLRWEIIYKTPGLPELPVTGVEILKFAGEKICRIEDHYDPGSMEGIASFFEEHSDKLRQKVAV